MPGRKFFAVVCLLSVLLLFGCSHLSKNEPKKPEPPTEFAAMIAKKAELAALKPTEKLGKKPTIKGKIAIVRNSDGDIAIDRFAEDGSAFYTDPTITVNTFNNFLPHELYAKTPEEIETLIRIDCVTKSDEAIYTNSRNDKDEPMIYKYVICDVGFIDYKTATLTAKKQVGKNEPPRVINNNTIARIPWDEINEYLNSATGATKAGAL